MATGVGYVTMNRVPGAHASVFDLREGLTPGWLVSSTAMLSLTDSRERKWALLQRDANAQVSPGKWQFPGGRCGLNELPLHTACRELAEEVRISGAAEHWGEVLIRVGGCEVDYLTAESLHRFRARYVFVHNTVEFFYPMELRVSSLDEVCLTDAETYGRAVKLFSREELLALAEQEMLTAPAEAMVQQELALSASFAKLVR